MVAIAIIIGVVIGLKKADKMNTLVKEGKMIKRDIRFAENGEEFTSKIGSYSALAEAIKGFGIPCSADGNTSDSVAFKGATFSARLYKVKFDEPSGIGIFRFEFTSWKTYRGMYENYNEMNMLMTTVEKAFLSLDPNTAVKEYKIDFNTKHSIF